VILLCDRHTEHSSPKRQTQKRIPAFLICPGSKQWGWAKYLLHKKILLIFTVERIKAQLLVSLKMVRISLEKSSQKEVKLRKLL
jgi:hypothetical protein